MSSSIYDLRRFFFSQVSQFLFLCLTHLNLDVPNLDAADLLTGAVITRCVARAILVFSFFPALTATAKDSFTIGGVAKRSPGGRCPCTVV